MSRRWWGLGPRQTAALFAAALLIGVGVAFVLGPDGGDPDDGAALRAPSITRVAVGSEGTAAAVWVFGFETVRLDPALRRGGQLALRGFGDVVGTRAAVVMFDAGTGRVGILDARRNELRTVATLTAGTNADQAFVPTIAVSGSALWVAPDPGVVVRVDPTTGVASAPLRVAGVTGSATGLVGDDGAVFAATATPAGVEVAAVAAGDGDPSDPALVPGATLDGLALDPSTVWLRSGTRLYGLDRTTLAVARTVDVPSPGGAARIGGLAAVAGAVWVLGDGGSTLVRYDPDRDRFTRAARLLDRRPVAVEVPAALAAAGDRVVAMVQRSGSTGLAVRVVVHDAARDRTRAVDVPGRIAPGALAVSGSGASEGSG